MKTKSIVEEYYNCYDKDGKFRPRAPKYDNTEQKESHSKLYGFIGICINVTLVLITIKGTIDCWIEKDWWHMLGFALINSYLTVSFIENTRLGRYVEKLGYDIGTKLGRLINKLIKNKHE